MRTRLRSSSSNPMPSTSQSEGHRSVLLHEAISALDIQKGDAVVDATLGGAGHAKEIAQRLGLSGKLIGFDLDAAAIARANAALADAKCETLLIRANFRDLKKELTKRGVTSIEKALFDLGWSSFQLDAGRGFSFQKEEPLLMTYADSPNEHALTAAVIVNEWEETSLADIIYGWGEERYARRIAKAIVQRRDRKPFETSRELAEVVKLAVPGSYAHGRIHPATRTFQALRIAVNDELGAVDEGLASAFELLGQGGRIAVITFHSIEDRLVKRLLRSLEGKGVARRLTKKPIIPNDAELKANPRARSAKLRTIEKI